MALLQAYQVKLLKELDQGQRLSLEMVTELSCTTDLAPQATKQTAVAIIRSMVAMVVTEKQLELKRQGCNLLLSGGIFL